MSPFGFRVINRFCYAFAMFDTRQFETVFTCGRTLGCPQSEPDISLFDIRWQVCIMKAERADDKPLTYRALRAPLRFRRLEE